MIYLELVKLTHLNLHPSSCPFLLSKLSTAVFDLNNCSSFSTLTFRVQVTGNWISGLQTFSGKKVNLKTDVKWKSFQKIEVNNLKTTTFTYSVHVLLDMLQPHLIGLDIVINGNFSNTLVLHRIEYAMAIPCRTDR